MKRIVFFIFCLIAFIGVIAPQTVFADDTWKIADFKSDITIQPSGDVLVKETITADFTTAHHGIIRQIPYAYKNDDGSKYYTSVTMQSIMRDGFGEQYIHTRTEANEEYKIGNPDITLTGQHTYTLTYAVRGVLRSFDNYDELYWNATGNGWDVPIEGSSATIALPQAGIVQSACYEGSYGSQSRCAAGKIGETIAVFTSSKKLDANQGLTVALDYTKGMVPIATVEQPRYVSPWLQGVVGFALTGGIGILLVFLFWVRRGRDQYWQRKSLNDPNATIQTVPLWGHKETIVPEFAAPDGLRPGELGVLIDERADILDITTTIVDLAIRGYLTIQELEATGVVKFVTKQNSYLLTRTSKPATDLLDYEQFLLTKLFATKDKVTVSELSTIIAPDIEKIKERFYIAAMNKQLFLENPKKTQGVFVTLGGILLVVAYLLFNINLYPWMIGATIGVMAVAALLFIFSNKMSRRSAKGHELLRQTLGYKLFISTTEKYRQKFLENENLFMDVLPYAILFGLTDKLAKSMKNMGIQPASPGWYVGSHPFSVDSFGSSMKAMAAGIAVASTPKGSGGGGGGFSGGGFGGGGGGGW